MPMKRERKTRNDFTYFSVFVSFWPNLAKISVKITGR